MNKLVNKNTFRRILIRNLVLPLALGFLTSVVFLTLIIYLSNSSSWVEHTSHVIAESYKVEKLLMDSETQMRGYVTTGQESFLAPYNSTMASLIEEIKKLQVLISDNSEQVVRAAQTHSILREWMAHGNRVIELQRKGTEKSRQIAFQGEGKILIDRLRDIFQQFREAERVLLGKRTDAVNRLSSVISFTVIGLSLLSGILIAWMGRSQLFALSKSYESSIATQEEQNTKLERRQWIDSGLAKLTQNVIGVKDVTMLMDQVLRYLAEYLGAKVAVGYVTEDGRTFEFAGGFALRDEFKTHIKHFIRGEGQLGLAVAEERAIELKDVSLSYLKVASGLGEDYVKHIVIVPMSTEGQISTVIELGFFEPADESTMAFLNEGGKAISMLIRAGQYRQRLEKLLEEVQNQAEELQAQQEELRGSNEEFEEQTKLLKEAQTRLGSQYAELEQTNLQLEEQTQTSERQKAVMRVRNDELNAIRLELERKADELQKASKYKSEFLANMSHELRTPLNSSLILAKLLSENKENNLTHKQVEFAEQIMNSGNDLLDLINDILDLSKVEAGKLEISPEHISLEGLARSLERLFRPIAEQRDLDFTLSILPGTPSQMFSDRSRVEQIMKNLLSNAFKFTEGGRVSLAVGKNSEPQYQNMLTLSVADTGVGIPLNQQDIIFEAFSQADGTTSRKFGGTGLGLSISQNLARLLGGLIRVKSEPGKGSVFTLLLPVEYKPAKEKADEALPQKSIERGPMALAPTLTVEIEEKETIKVLIPDDRDVVSQDSSQNLLLAVGDDPHFAKILLDLAHDQGFRAIVAGTAEDAFIAAKEFPLSAVILDMSLPDHSGLLVLDNLKQHPMTRHIPVHVIAAHDFAQKALEMGAIGFLFKPVKHKALTEAFIRLKEKMTQNIKRVLVVEDDVIQQKAIRSLIQDTQIEVIAVETGKEALKRLQDEIFDCMIMDISLPDMNGFELLDKIVMQGKNHHPPLIVYTGRNLNREEEEKLRRHSQSLIIKGAKSPDRLLNEVTLFLHRVESQLGSEQQQMLETLRNREKFFDSKSILLVDDDTRNVFSLTAALEQKGARVIVARNGQEALKKLNSGENIHLILMDIMMPVMNGYEAMKEIRSQSKFLKLPIIALTAKAMKDDRDLCLQAGANDYLTKPIDKDKLLSLMRIWISYGEA